jgi:hypothetical protein
MAIGATRLPERYLSSCDQFDAWLASGGEDQAIMRCSQKFDRSPREGWIQAGYWLDSCRIWLLCAILSVKFKYS